MLTVEQVQNIKQMLLSENSDDFELGETMLYLVMKEETITEGDFWELLKLVNHVTINGRIYMSMNGYQVVCMVNPMYDGDLSNESI